MILSDIMLKSMLEDGSLSVDPLTPEQIQPASIDVRLGTHFLKVDENRSDVLRLDSEVSYEELEQEEIVIPPLSFLLATTQEYIRLPDNVTAFVEGRSSIGRMGLFIQNAGWVDPGYRKQPMVQGSQEAPHPRPLQSLLRGRRRRSPRRFSSSTN